MDALRGAAEARALLVLDQLPGVGLVRIRRLVERFGSGVAALDASARAFASVAGREAAAQRSDSAIRELVDTGLARADRLGVSVLTWGSPMYPASLRHLADPPPVLFLRGRSDLLDADLVTVVGARRATARARDVAERLGVGLGRAGVTVASGMALGVDGAAHRGALLARGTTIAVLGTGPDVAYPHSHRHLFHDIVKSGLIVSEFLPGTPALPHHFPRRNRILAALARATVVVEAGARSGALITVDHALDLGRDVWVVPGQIERATCAGSNRLLVDGARPLLSVADFVAEVAPTTAETRRHLPADGPETHALRELGRDPRSVDDLAAALGLTVPYTLVLLTSLEVQGAAERLPGMRFRRAA